MQNNIHGVVTFDQRRTSGDKSTHTRLVAYLEHEIIDDIRHASIVFWHEGQPVRMSGLRYLAYAHGKGLVSRPR